MDDPDEPELEVGPEVWELQTQLDELNGQLWANLEKMAEAYDALDCPKC